MKFYYLKINIFDFSFISVLLNQNPRVLHLACARSLPFAPMTSSFSMIVSPKNLVEFPKENINWNFLFIFNFLLTTTTPQPTPTTTTIHIKIENKKISKKKTDFKKQKEAEENAQKLFVTQQLMKLKSESKTPEEEADQDQERRLMEQYALSPTTETIISADGDQLTIHHPREEPIKRSKTKLRDYFVSEFGIYNFLLSFFYFQKNYIFHFSPTSRVNHFVVI